jgi:PAS domain S-box-containing protein
MQEEQEELHHLLELQALVAAVSTRFINVIFEDSEAEIVSSLGTIAGFLGAEMAALNMLGTTEGFLKSRYYWFLPDVEKIEPAEVDGDNFSQFTWTFELLKKGQCMLVLSEESLPEEAEMERQVYRAVGMQSVFHIPIFKDRNLSGIISFFTFTKPLFLDEDTICLMKLLGEIFANLYSREEAEKALAESERRYKEMAELLPLTIYEMTTEGILTFVNRKGCELFGYKPEEFSQGISCLDMLAPIEREKGARTLSSQESITGSPHFYELLKKNGSRFPGHIYSTVVARNGRTEGVRGVIVDLTEQKAAEEKIRASLQEKEILLKEIHHRVKNNMQLMLSLIHLQLNVVQEPAARKILQITRNRMKSIALIHEQFYRSSDFRLVDIMPFITTMLAQLKCTYPDKKLEISVNDAELVMDIQRAIPFGIIINEILSNAFQHAFENDQGGLIFIEVENKDETEWKITVGDEGRGIPPHIDLQAPETLGLRLIRDLVEQIDGRLAIELEHGTVYTLHIPR